MKKMSDQELLKKYPEYKQYPKYGAYVSNHSKISSQKVPEEELDFHEIPGKKGQLVLAAGTEIKNAMTSTSFLKDLKDSKQEIFSTLNIPQIEKRRHLTAEKLAKNLLKRVDFKELYRKLPDLTYQKLGGIYMGLVSSVDREDGKMTVCIGKFDNAPIEYELLLKDLPGETRYTKGDTAFLDVKKNGEYVLSDYFAFNKSRIDQLQKMGIEINGDKMIHYKTRSGKSLKGKIVGLGQDVTGNQIIFQTSDGKKFPLSFDQLRKGMKTASAEHKNLHVQPNNKNILTKKVA